MYCCMYLHVLGKIEHVMIEFYHRCSTFCTCVFYSNSVNLFIYRYAFVNMYMYKMLAILSVHSR